MLYADDTVLMAESSADLQNQLNSFQDYCSRMFSVTLDKHIVPYPIGHTYMTYIHDIDL